MRKIKWLNIILLILFIISCLVVLKDVVIISTSFKSFTLYGIITNIIAWLLIGNIGEYLYDEMQ